MEKPPNTDILGWYVNKLYKKALDHCLQQSTVIPTSAPGQSYRGHVQGHSNSNVKSPVYNSTLDCDPSSCTRTIQKDDTNYQDMNDGQGQKSYLQAQICRSLNQVMTHDPGSWGRRSQPPVVKEIDDMTRNGRCERPVLKPDGKDLVWFRHSALPRQTNTQIPISRLSFSKDDSVLCHHFPNMDTKMFNSVVPPQHSVNKERGSDKTIPCPHSVNMEHRWSQNSCSHQHSAKMDSRGSLSTCTCPHQHSVNANSQFQPSAISNDRPVTNVSIDMKKAQNFKSSIFLSLKSTHHNSNADAEKTSHPNPGPRSEQSCVVAGHGSNSVELKDPDVVENTGHGARSLPTCDVQSYNELVEPCEPVKPVVECSSCSPKMVPDHQTDTKDTSTECTGLQSQEIEGLEILLDPDDNERIEPVSSPLPTPLISAAFEDPVNQLSDSSHNVPPMTNESDGPVIAVPNSSHVVPLTNESLELHNEVLSGSSPSQDKGADSDSGDSCKSGIVIKPGHSNQKRKRSLSLDKKGNKRRSSGTTKDRSSNPANTKRPFKGNTTSAPGKFSRNKNRDKSSKSKKGGKHVADTRYHLRRSCQRKSTNHIKSTVDVSKTTVKKRKGNTGVELFDISNKKIDSNMSEHVKLCIGREIRILQAHEDQALSTDSELDSNRLSSLAFLDLKDLAQVPEPCKSLENQSVYMSKKHVGGVWNSIVKKQKYVF